MNVRNLMDYLIMMNLRSSTEQTEGINLMQKIPPQVLALESKMKTLQ